MMHPLSCLAWRIKIAQEKILACCMIFVGLELALMCGCLWSMPLSFIEILLGPDPDQNSPRSLLLSSSGLTRLSWPVAWKCNIISLFKAAQNLVDHHICPYHFCNYYFPRLILAQCHYFIAIAFVQFCPTGFKGEFFDLSWLHGRCSGVARSGVGESPKSCRSVSLLPQPWTRRRLWFWWQWKESQKGAWRCFFCACGFDSMIWLRCMYNNMEWQLKTTKRSGTVLRNDREDRKRATTAKNEY